MNIYLDMDGVLVDLVGGINKSFRQNRKLPRIDVYHLNSIFKFDAVAKITNASDTWWTNLPRTEFASSIVETLTDRYSPSHIKILTKYCSPACAAGKIVWMKYNYPRLAEQIILVSGDKSFACCGYDDILLDDCDENILAWTASGGRAVTVPQPWNSNRCLTVSHIDEALDQMHG